MSDVRFIRKGGRVIPIRDPSGASKLAKVKKVAKAVGKAAVSDTAFRAAGVAGAAYGIKRGLKQRKANPKQDVKVNQGLNALGLGLSVASGAVGAATFSMGLKGILGGAIAGHALDAGGIAANIASVAGKGKFKERATQAARQEARNFVVGNAVYGAGLLATHRNRAKLAEYAGKIAAFGRKALKLG